MVDVAYIDEVTPAGIYIIDDVGVDFEKRDDFERIKETIDDVMVWCGVKNLEFADVTESEQSGAQGAFTC